jgi:hypothetical protein
MTRPQPPSGVSAPTTAQLPDGTVIELEPLARTICERFYAQYPEELERSGITGAAWCRHDNQYLLAWAIQDARDHTVLLVEQAVWLADVLEHRGFPTAQLVGNLEIAAAVVRGESDLKSLAEPAAFALQQAANACKQ